MFNTNDQATRMLEIRKAVQNDPDQSWRDTVASRWADFLLKIIRRDRKQAEEWLSYTEQTVGRGVDLARLHAAGRARMLACESREKFAEDIRSGSVAKNDDRIAWEVAMRFSSEVRGE